MTLGSRRLTVTLPPELRHPGPFGSSLVRRALDELLRRHPHLDVLDVDWQIDLGDEREAPRWKGPWVLVDLGQPSDLIEIAPAWAVWKFGIWKRTGACHTIDENGAASDDPYFEIEP